MLWFSSSGLYRTPKHLRALIISMASMLAAACSTLPSDGPTIWDIRSEYEHGPARPFELVDVSANTLEALKARSDTSLASRFGDYRPAPDITIGPGDGVTVNIWETGSDTLFSSAGGIPGAGFPTALGARGTLIPEQIVGNDGGISIPFAGRIPAAGKTTLDVQNAIEKALAGKAEKPQVLVNVSHAFSNTITIIGEGASSARVPLSVRGDRLLDVLATAGGSRSASYDTSIQLTRDGASVSMPLSRIISDPKEDIFLRPGDDLAITIQPQTFTVFGATGRSAQINFDSAKINLMEAIAKSGGLQDGRADPQGIYLFRFEPRAVAGTVGDLASMNPAQDMIPVVYKLDMTKANSYFLAQNFQVQDHDMLYVASAPTNQLQKFLVLVGLISQPVIQGAVVESAIK